MALEPAAFELQLRHPPSSLVHCHAHPLVKRRARAPALVIEVKALTAPVRRPVTPRRTTRHTAIPGWHPLRPPHLTATVRRAVQRLERNLVDRLPCREPLEAVEHRQRRPHHLLIPALCALQHEWSVLLSLLHHQSCNPFEPCRPKHAGLRVQHGLDCGQKVGILIVPLRVVLSGHCHLVFHVSDALLGKAGALEQPLELVHNLLRHLVDQVAPLAQHLLEGERRQIDGEVALDHDHRPIDTRAQHLDARERTEERPAAQQGEVQRR